MAGSANADDSQLSMREKSSRKKKVNKLHESNYRAGTVPVNERQLHRTGIRGRKIYILMFFLVLLLLVCLVNMIILVLMYGTLDITYAGMKTISFEKDGTLKWLLDSDLEYVFPRDNVIGGFKEENLSFEGHDQNVQFLAGSTQNMSSVTVGPDGTTVQMRNAYQFIDPHVGKKILHLSKDSSLSVTSMQTGPELKTSNLKTARIVSDDDQDLTITGKDITATGNEGIFMDGKTVEMNGKESVEVKVTDAGSAIQLDGNKGVQLVRDKLKDTSSSVTVVSGVTKYRLCACANNGRLYKVPLTSGAKITCTMVKQDPCA